MARCMAAIFDDQLVPDKATSQAEVTSPQTGKVSVSVFRRMS